MLHEFILNIADLSKRLFLSIFHHIQSLFPTIFPGSCLASVILNMEVSPSSPQSGSNNDSHKKDVSKKDRRYQLAKLIVIAFVSAVTVALIIVDVTGTAKSFQKKIELNYKMQGSIVTATVIHNLQEERGMTVVQLGYKQLNFKTQRLALDEIRRKTNQSILLLQKRADARLQNFEGNKRSFQHILENWRSEIDQGRANIIEILQQYKTWTEKLISWMSKFVESENLEDYSHLFYAYEMLVLSKEEAGMERAVGGLKLTHGENFTVTDTFWYNRKRVLAENYLKTGFLFSEELKAIHTSVFANNLQTMKKIEEKRNSLSSELYSKSSEDVAAAYEWFDLMTIYSNLMLELQKQLADLIMKKVDEKIQECTNQLIIRSLLLCFTLIVVPCIVVSLAKVQKRFYEYTLSLLDKVDLEQGRTDFLMQENARHCDSKYKYVN
jgi:hypothetical protein